MVKEDSESARPSGGLFETTQGMRRRLGTCQRRARPRLSCVCRNGTPPGRRASRRGGRRTRAGRCSADASTCG